MVINFNDSNTKLNVVRNHTIFASSGWRSAHPGGLLFLLIGQLEPAGLLVVVSRHGDGPGDAVPGVARQQLAGLAPLAVPGPRERRVAPVRLPVQRRGGAGEALAARPLGQRRLARGLVPQEGRGAVLAQVPGGRRLLEGLTGLGGARALRVVEVARVGRVGRVGRDGPVPAGLAAPGRRRAVRVREPAAAARAARRPARAAVRAARTAPARRARPAQRLRARTPSQLQ